MTTSSATPKAMLWTGRVMSGLFIAFMLFDSIIKLILIQPVADASRQLGLPADMSRPIGVIELVITILYAIPRTSLLGVVLLMSVLGGAITTHWRLGNPLFSHILFGVYLGLLAWGGLWLRDPKVRAVMPLMR
jgi:hypothetical protein